MNNQITKLTDNLKISKNKETSLTDERDELNQELQKKEKAIAKISREKHEIEKENEELKNRIRRLSSSIQVEVTFQTVFDLGQVSVEMSWFGVIKDLSILYLIKKFIFRHQLGYTEPTSLSFSLS